MLLATSGLRPGVLSTRHGRQEPDGLRLGDLRELKLGAKPHFDNVPFLIALPPRLSKNRKPGLTFGSAECADAILSYLALRASRGEKLTERSPLITVEPRASRSHFRPAKDGALFVDEGNLALEIRSAMDKVRPAGVTWRTYTLRSWFSSMCELGERKGLCTRNVRELWMNHRSTIDSTYNTGKTLSAESVEELRKMYEAVADEFLTLAPRPRRDTAIQFRLNLLETVGVTGKDAERYADSNEETLRTVREKLLKSQADAPDGPPNGAAGLSIQKPVPLAEAEPLLAAGYRFVANFGPDKVLLEPPVEK